MEETVTVSPTLDDLLGAGQVELALLRRLSVEAKRAAEVQADRERAKQLATYRSTLAAFFPASLHPYINALRDDEAAQPGSWGQTIRVDCPSMAPIYIAMWYDAGKQTCGFNGTDALTIAEPIIGTAVWDPDFEMTTSYEVIWGFGDNQIKANNLPVALAKAAEMWSLYAESEEVARVKTYAAREELERARIEAQPSAATLTKKLIVEAAPEPTWHDRMLEQVDAVRPAAGDMCGQLMLLQVIAEALVELASTPH